MWDQLISEILQARQLSLRSLANLLGVTEESLRKLRVGQTQAPRFKIGQQLLAIHFRACPERYVVAPSRAKKKDCLVKSDE